MSVGAQLQPFMCLYISDQARLFVVLCQPAVAGMGVRFFAVFCAAVYAPKVSGASDADEALPAINVKYEFPAVTTILSSKSGAAAADHEEAFAARVQRAHEQLDRIEQVAGTFAKQAGADLDRLHDVLTALAA